MGVFVNSKKNDKLGWGLQTVLGSLLWESTAAYTLAMKQDQKECGELAGLLGSCSVPKDTGELESSGGLWSVVQIEHL